MTETFKEFVERREEEHKEDMAKYAEYREIYEETRRKLEFWEETHDTEVELSLLTVTLCIRCYPNEHSNLRGLLRDFILCFSPNRSEWTRRRQAVVDSNTGISLVVFSHKEKKLRLDLEFLAYYAGTCQVEAYEETVTKYKYDCSVIKK